MTDRVNFVVRTTSNGAILVKEWDAPFREWAFESRREAADFIASKFGVAPLASPDDRESE